MIGVRKGVDVVEKCLRIRFNCGEYLASAGENYQLGVADLDGCWDYVMGAVCGAGTGVEFFPSGP